MQREYEEWIIVNLHARFVDDGSQMLARHSQSGHEQFILSPSIAWGTMAYQLFSIFANDSSNDG
jgi:hypothetical protein